MGLFQEMGMGLDALIIDIKEWLSEKTKPPESKPDTINQSRGISKGLGDSFEWL